VQALDDYKPLVAVRVGYMRACVFFSDDNNNGQADLAIGERSQPSGPRGEVSLFLPGESAKLVVPIRQEPFVPECDDSLSGKKMAALQFRASAGVLACTCCCPHMRINLQAHVYHMAQSTDFMHCDAKPWPESTHQ
jgi:hypothetical protein